MNKRYTYSLVDSFGRTVYVSQRSTTKGVAREEARVAHAHMALAQGVHSRPRLHLAGAEPRTYQGAT